VEDRVSGLEDKIDIKKKQQKERKLREKTEVLWKEYARTLKCHQKTNHGHQRRRDTSQWHKKYIQQNNSRKIAKP
jgi:3-hydroxy-3-methylglutaryl CoA synthase